jgi:hypothetical protein
MRTPHAVRTTLSSQEKENNVNHIQRYYSFQFDWFVEGEILDFPLSTIPTVSRYEKYGVFRKLHKSIELETVEWRKRQRRRRCVVGSIFFLKTCFSAARRLRWSYHTVQLALRKRSISYKFEFLRRQYQAGSLNFLSEQGLFSISRTQHGKISKTRARRWPILRWMLRAQFFFPRHPKKPNRHLIPYSID